MVDFPIQNLDFGKLLLFIVLKLLLLGASCRSSLFIEQL